MSTTADFVQKTYDMVSAGHAEIGWSEDGREIIVFNAERLAASNKLRESSNTTKFESWVRRLNSYGFEKVRGSKPPRWFHPSFTRDHPEHLALVKVQRKEEQPNKRDAPDEEEVAHGRGAKRQAKSPAAATAATTDAAMAGAASISVGSLAHVGAIPDANRLLAEQLQNNLLDIRRAHEHLHEMETLDYGRRLWAIRMMQASMARSAAMHAATQLAAPRPLMLTHQPGSPPPIVPATTTAGGGTEEEEEGEEPPLIKQEASSSSAATEPPLFQPSSSGSAGGADGTATAAAAAAAAAADVEPELDRVVPVVELSELDASSLRRAASAAPEPAFAYLLAASIDRLPEAAEQLGEDDKALVDKIFEVMDEQLNKAIANSGGVPALDASAAAAGWDGRGHHQKGGVGDSNYGMMAEVHEVTGVSPTPGAEGDD